MGRDTRRTRRVGGHFGAAVTTSVPGCGGASAPAPITAPNNPGEVLPPSSLTSRRSPERNGLSLRIAPTAPAADTTTFTGQRDRPSKSLADTLTKESERQQNGEVQDRRHLKILDDDRSETLKTFLNADGSRTTEISADATSFQDGDGKWQDV